MADGNLSMMKHKLGDERKKLEMGVRAAGCISEWNTFR
jgi:hypothetical protein